MAVALADDVPFGWLVWHSPQYSTPIPLRPVEGVTTFTVGRSYLCDVTVPPEIAVRSVYKRIAETKHCKLTRLENGKIGLTGYTMAGTFVNGVKVKFLYTAILKDGDVVSFISVERGPSSTFHTGVSTISSNNVGDVVNCVDDGERLVGVWQSQSKPRHKDLLKQISVTKSLKRQRHLPYKIIGLFQWLAADIYDRKPRHSYLKLLSQQWV